MSKRQADTRRSTVEVGDEFRDDVARLFRSAGFSVRMECLVAGKTVDILAQRKVSFSIESIALEAKKYNGTLPLAVVTDFVNAYETMVRRGDVTGAFLVSINGITPQGQQLIDGAKPYNIQHFLWSEVQNEIFGPAEYMNALIRDYEADRIGEYYIEPKDKDGNSVTATVNAWMDDTSPEPLYIFGEYGTGKSTFAQYFSYTLARKYVAKEQTRIPILVPLGQLFEETSLEGLFAKILAAQYRVNNWHYEVFRELNRLGRFVIIYDGLDEMKHGMSFDVFQRELYKLLELSEGFSKIILLGRPSVFPSDPEFKSVMAGKRTSISGSYIDPNGRPSKNLELAKWSNEDVNAFFNGFFRVLAKGGDKSSDWIDDRIRQLVEFEDRELILRPVHAQMLCWLALEPRLSLRSVDAFTLYDRFVEFLLSREVKKVGRHPGFDVSVRRAFNAAVAWWLLSNNAASTTTLNDLPDRLCNECVAGLPINLAGGALKAELIAGCLVEKAGGIVYFGHRSIQEFLAAEYLYTSRFLTRGGLSTPEAIFDIANSANVQVCEFLGAHFVVQRDGRRVAEACYELLLGCRSLLSVTALEPFLVAYRSAQSDNNDDHPWLYALRYFNSDLSTSEKCTKLFKEINGSVLSRETWLMAVQIYCVEFGYMTDAERDRAILTFLRPDVFKSLLERTRNGLEKSVIKRGDEYRHAAVHAGLTPQRTEGGGVVWVFSFEKLRLECAKALGYGIFDPVTNTSDGELPSINVTALVDKFQMRGREYIHAYLRNPNAHQKLSIIDVQHRTIGQKRHSR